MSAPVPTRDEALAEAADALRAQSPDTARAWMELADRLEGRSFAEEGS